MADDTEREIDTTDRDRAELLFADASAHLQAVDPYEGETRDTYIGYTQVLLLQAIYHELRHGHDQVERQVEVLAAHTKALKEHADEMDDLKKAPYFQGDAHGRGR
jgi:hypothetical protein